MDVSADVDRVVSHADTIVHRANNRVTPQTPHVDERSMTMSDPEKLAILAELRRAKGITLQQMAEACGLDGKRSRESVAAWERGLSIPHTRKRAKLIDYVGNTLGLRRDPHLFQMVWDVLVEQWGWEPIDSVEWQQHFAPGSPLHLPRLVVPAASPTQMELSEADALLERLPTAGAHDVEDVGYS
jgi:transcriptional regulator with XRE-family HTH domain